MSNSASLILYYSVFGFSILASALYQGRAQNTAFFYRKIIYFLLIVTPVIVMQSYRYDVGTDYQAYNVLFSGIIQGPDNYAYKAYMKEPLYLLENIISYKLWGNSTGLFFIDAVIECVLIFFAFDYFKDKISMPMSYALCYFTVYPMFFNIERQAVAAVIVWFGLRFLVEKKFIKYLICIMIAACFHNTAIAALGLYLIHYIKKILADKRVWMIAGGVAFIVLSAPKRGIAFVMGIIPNFLIYRTYLLESSQGVSMAYVLPLLSVLPCLFFFSVLRKNDRFNVIYIYIYLTDVCILISSNVVAYGTRFMLYCDISTMILVSMTCKSLKNKTNKLFIPFAYIIVLLIYFYLLYYVTGHSAIFPYQTLGMRR